MPMVLSEYCDRCERRRIFAGVGGLCAECMSCGQLIAGPVSKLPNRFRAPVAHQLHYSRFADLAG